jgi:hypothetical protein
MDRALGHLVEIILDREETALDHENRPCVDCFKQCMTVHDDGGNSKLFVWYCLPSKFLIKPTCIGHR